MTLVQEKIRVKIPASTANLGSGFDSIGIAFQLYITLEVELAEETQFIWKGKELQNLTIRDEDNLILKAIERVYMRFQKKRPHFKMEVTSDIPLTRGLGSSASAYIGGLVVANEWLDRPLSDEDLLWLATEEEGHPDNVGASLQGGVFIGSVDWKKSQVFFHKQQFPQEWKFILAIPSYTLSTSMARDILPKEYSKEDAIFNLSRFGLLISSISSSNKEGVSHGLEDALHQPYRQKLIPGFAELVDRKEELGVIGFTISGAGPTILALIEEQLEIDPIKNEMINALTVESHSVEILVLEVDQNGYTVEKLGIESVY
jgi:homoserine kinase